MSTITINADEQWMISVISDIIDISQSWRYFDSNGDKIQINFTGDNRAVMQALYKRLTQPARVQYMFSLPIKEDTPNESDSKT